jgi:hypothetical protein
MTRFSAAALFLAPLCLFPTASVAANNGQAPFRAELATPSGQPRLVVRDMVWRCDGGICVAPKGSSRPAVVCAALVREAGALRSFTVDGDALPADQLEKCNARAR